MSNYVSGYVWKHSQYKGGVLLVLLALADWCDDQGYCYPGIVTLSNKVRMSTRQTQRIITQLITDGAITQLSRGGKHKGSSRYTVNMPKCPVDPEGQSQQDKSDSQQDKSGRSTGHGCPPIHQGHIRETSGKIKGTFSGNEGADW